MFGEIFASLDGLRDARKRLARWMRPRRRSIDALLYPGARNRLIPQPLGVVGVIVPWNYPIFLSFGPLTGALAAGNRAMVKMSENSRRLAELLERDFAEIPARGQARLLSRRGRPRAGVLVTAVRPSFLHRVGDHGAGSDGQRRPQPDAGDARAGRQVACDRCAGLPDRDRGRAHHVGEDLQRRADLRRGRLRVPAARNRGRIRQPLPAGVRQAVSGHQRPRLHLDHRPAVVRPARRRPRRRAPEGREARQSRRGPDARQVEAPVPAAHCLKRNGRDGADAARDLRARSCRS